MKKTIATLFACLLLAAGFSCAKNPGLQVDPAQDEFFDMTRHIMTGEEIEIYRHLPDLDSRKAFAREFWEKRDPDPGTPDNEAYTDFMQRIEFAIRHFDEHRGQKRGWDSLRGRILLQLGFPDERETGNKVFNNGRDYRYEIWYYRQYQLYLTFIDRQGFGQYEIYGRYPPALAEAASKSRFRLPDTNRGEHSFRFDSDCRPGEIRIVIPTGQLLFNESTDRLEARFSFQINVYRNYRFVEAIRKDLEYSDSPQTVLKQKEIIYKIPFSGQQKGRYYLEIIGKDEQSGSRYRNFCKIRI